KSLEAKIIELDKNRNNVVLSRRAWLEETQKEQREDFLQNLKPGEVRRGTVSSVVNFGAFVDLGGMDGLVHVSELSWKHVDHPSSVVQVGDEIDVQVLEVDMERERISLSLKQAAEGGEVAEEYREAFGEHAYDEHGNYIGGDPAAPAAGFTPETEAQAAWADYAAGPAETPAEAPAAEPPAGEPEGPI